jgi:hypothetical protein
VYGDNCELFCIIKLFSIVKASLLFVHFLLHGSTISAHRLNCVHEHRLFKSRLRVSTHPSDLIDVFSQLWCELLPCLPLSISHLDMFAVILAKNLIFKALLSLMNPSLVEVNGGH